MGPADVNKPEIWARSHLYLGPSVDMHVAASIQWVFLLRYLEGFAIPLTLRLCKLKDYWGGVCESKPEDSSYSELAIETLTAQCDLLIAKWFSEQGE